MNRYAGHIVDLCEGTITPGDLLEAGGKIVEISPRSDVPNRFIIPGFIDAHVHVESSMLTPSEFARLAVIHGVIASVSDPHEIANVLGIDGVLWMLDNARFSPFKFAFGAPSCVPATAFETAGAVLGVEEVTELLRHPEIYYLSEVMNFPGVLQRDPALLAKIRAAQEFGKPIDGHAPGLRSPDVERYAEVGISTDHECFSLEEARDKIRAGMKILIREGSAAKNFEALFPLLLESPDRCMFCTDDAHPDYLRDGTIIRQVRRAIGQGVDPLTVLRCASLYLREHYRLPVGMLAPGDPADFLIVDDLKHLNVLETYIDGQCVARNGRCLLERVPASHVNAFRARPVSEASLVVRADGISVRSIHVVPGQLVTRERIAQPRIADGTAQADPESDLNKVVAYDRYTGGEVKPAVGFVSGFGLRRGAVASTVAHDSHNIVAVGVSDRNIVRAINLLIERRGGVSLVGGTREQVLQLPIAGLMTDADGWQVANEYEMLDLEARKLGSTLPSPFMTLSFLALLVIPDLKISDRGLFSGSSFSFVPLWNS